MPQTITVTDNRTGESYELPIENGGIAAKDFAKAVPGVWFYDPAFMQTAAAESAITYLDGEAGICVLDAVIPACCILVYSLQPSNIVVAVAHQMYIDYPWSGG